MPYEGGADKDWNIDFVWVHAHTHACICTLATEVC